jgi:hypothetical protein
MRTLESRVLTPDEEQRRHVVEQLERALGDEWVARNAPLVEAYLQAAVEFGYAMPDERRAPEQETG